MRVLSSKNRKMNLKTPIRQKRVCQFTSVWQPESRSIRDQAVEEELMKATGGMPSCRLSCKLTRTGGLAGGVRLGRELGVSTTVDSKETGCKQLLIYSMKVIPFCYNNILEAKKF